ncbi:uncharacterized protein [Excalfactoria chinensis]|uniref:uncharacterized protein isoform X2 n=1 Tax=Excalfactoria chinensis TaxID=46218 RepID=UPI003B3AA3DD
MAASPPAAAGFVLAGWPGCPLPPQPVLRCWGREAGAGGGGSLDPRCPYGAAQRQGVRQGREQCYSASGTLVLERGVRFTCSFLFISINQLRGPYGDTERAVEILTRYQSTLHSPEEQELKASIGKISHIFQSELFQALLDIHEFYDFTLRSASLQPPSPAVHRSPARHRRPREPHSPPEPPAQDDEQRLLAVTPATPPRLVRVTARRTEAPTSICSLVLGSRSALPQDFV